MARGLKQLPCGPDLERVGVQLTKEEDAELRRLHLLVQYAAAAPWLVERYKSLRARDRRAEVRDVDDTELVQVLPGQGESADPPVPAD